MSKKTRRYRTPNLPTSAFGSVGGNGSAPVASDPAESTSMPAPRPKVAQAIAKNWQDDYHEVLGDLKKTGIIAVILMSGMLALSFFIS